MALGARGANSVIRALTNISEMYLRCEAGMILIAYEDWVSGLLGAKA